MYQKKIKKNKKTQKHGKKEKYAKLGDAKSCNKIYINKTKKSYQFEIVIHLDQNVLRMPKMPNFSPKNFIFVMLWNCLPRHNTWQMRHPKNIINAWWVDFSQIELFKIHLRQLKSTGKNHSFPYLKLILKHHDHLTQSKPSLIKLLWHKSKSHITQ